MLAAAAILLCCLFWSVAWLRRKVALRKRAKMRSNIETELRQKTSEICEFAILADKCVVIHRGFPGYVTMFAYPDFKARLAERGKSAVGHPAFEEITSMVSWFVDRRWYALSLSARGVGFHAVDTDDTVADFDLMPATTNKEDAVMIFNMVKEFHSYMGLPEALVEARRPKPIAPI
jgi:hypothetical protein